MDISAITSSPWFGWAMVILGLIIIFIILRFFMHIVVHLIRIFWKGCALIVLLVVIYLILHYLGIL